MNRRIKILFSCIVLILLLSGCKRSNPHVPVLDPALKPEDIIRLEVALNFCENPEGLSEAKFILDRQEIEAFLEAFQNTDIGREMAPIYGSLSVFRFFTADNLKKEVLIYDWTPRVLYVNTTCYECAFLGDDPWKLYNQSSAETVLVDRNFEKQ